MPRIYLDHNATTPVAPEVATRMDRAVRELWGNASSVHHFGQQAKAAVDEARSQVARLLGANSAEVIFTAGGTESDNFAIRGAAEALAPAGRRHLIASSIEHEAVLKTLAALARRGWRVTLLPVDASGVISPEALERAVTEDTALVSVMHANNEIGTVQPLAALAQIARAHGALFHTDAVQSAGKIPIDVNTLGVDLLSISAHKFYGPKGVGAMWLRKGVRLTPFMAGGRQERNRRAGTENVPGIVGLGAAAERAHATMHEDARRVGLLRDRLEAGLLTAVTGAERNGAGEPRVPNTTNISFQRIESESLLIGLDLDGIAVSSGSACSSGTLEPSHVLKAMGLPHARTLSSIRFSLGTSTTEAEVERVIAVLPRLVEKLRSLTTVGGTPFMKIVVAMSGGVDSSVAAALLAEQGHDVIGVSMQLYDQSEGQASFGTCCTIDDLYDARRVAAAIGIPHYILNFENRFTEQVVANFISEHGAGRTPIPCSHCNADLKFSTLLDRALGFGAEALATGHYARIDAKPDGNFQLRRGLDSAKDQTYFLFSLTRDQLARAAFPIGHLDKADVRQHAERLQLRVAAKPDSQEICFVPDGNYAKFIEKAAPELKRPGTLVNQEGQVVGGHAGVHRYTIGQRKGLGLSSKEPLYVLEIRSPAAEIVVGPKSALERMTLTASSVNWVSGSASDQWRSVGAQIRHKHTAARARVRALDQGRAEVEFEEAQSAITPGQAVVFYDGDVCLGGGWID